MPAAIVNTDNFYEMQLYADICISAGMNASTYTVGHFLTYIKSCYIIENFELKSIHYLITELQLLLNNKDNT